MNWSAPWQVNQDETGSQFFPHVAVDQTTGTVAVVWHDPRNDDGGSDSTANTETEVFAAISTDGRYFHEILVSDGSTRATNLQTSHGDYLGVAFHDDNIHVAWVDNSRDPASTPPECDPVPCMDAYTGRIPLPEPDPSVSLLVAGAALCGLSRRRARALRERVGHLATTRAR
jgi:hypothetical protein